MRKLSGLVNATVVIAMIATAVHAQQTSPDTARATRGCVWEADRNLLLIEAEENVGQGVDT
jgi:hypothetical protein